MTTTELKQRIAERLNCRSALVKDKTVLAACLKHIEELESPIAKAKRIAENGPKTLDAKWLDPECWDGCQSLLYKNKLEQLQSQLREREADCAAMREALLLAKDVTSNGFLPNPKTQRFDMTHFDVHDTIDKALSTTAGRELLERLQRYETALQKLSVLGNEPLPGNSDGNRIAQEALQPKEAK